MTIKQRDELFAREREISARAWLVRSLCGNAETAFKIETAIDKDQIQTLRLEVWLKNGQQHQINESACGDSQPQSKLAPYLMEALRKFQQDAEHEFVGLK